MTCTLKGGGHEKITADFFGQIFSLSSVKTENIILKFLEFIKVVKYRRLGLLGACAYYSKW